MAGKTVQAKNIGKTMKADFRESNFETLDSARDDALEHYMILCSQLQSQVELLKERLSEGDEND